MKNNIQKEISGIVHAILEDYGNGRAIDQMDIFNQPDRDAVIDIINKLLRIFFPGYYRDRAYRIYNAYTNLSVLIEDVMFNLNKQISIVLKYNTAFADASEGEILEQSERIAIAFFKKIPEIRAYVETDLQATFDGDPATQHREEIVFSYPGLLATTINRIAHELFRLGVPLIPRMMTEYAHSTTGIDIHPGATIGKYFFIDHGTGIVVGETTIIGEHVKIYQGVTLGALSTRGGQKLQGVKRHPTIEDNVTIYAGASILGGDTVIGKNSVIGSNAFITTSIPEGTRVSIKNQELQYKYKDSLRKSELEQDDSWYYII